MSFDNEDELPPGWTTTRLEVLGRWSTGGTPSRKRPELFNGSIPWVKSGDLPDGPLLKADESISEEGISSSAAKLLPVGTLVMALYGATIGKLAILDIEAATNQACASCVVDSRLAVTRFIFFYLLSQRKEFIEAGQGGAQPNISNGIVRDWPIPLPPLAEQRRIATAVEGLLTKVTDARERLERVLTTMRLFRHAVLAAGCTGQLTSDWREHRIVDAVPEVKVFDPEAINDTVPDLPDYPEHWCLTTVAVCSDLVQYGTSEKAASDGTVPLLRMGNIQEGRVDLTNLKMVREDLPGLEGLLLQQGDLLFNRTNSPDLVGKSAVFDVDLRATFASYLIRIRCKPDLLDSRLLSWWVNSPWGREWASRVRTDGVSQSNINGTKLQQMPVLLPPVPEQAEIVRRVSVLLALADSIEQRAKRALQRVESLTQSILAKAFRGELVPTEAELARREKRGYETAGELLARMRVGVADKPKVKRPRSRSSE